MSHRRNRTPLAPLKRRRFSAKRGDKPPYAKAGHNGTHPQARDGKGRDR